MLLQTAWDQQPRAELQQVFPSIGLANLCLAMKREVVVLLKTALQALLHARKHSPQVALASTDQPVLPDKVVASGRQRH